MTQFIRSSYWGRWSRVLSTSHPDGPFVEVNLTPIHSWEKEISHIRIRLHGTSRNSSDLIVSKLPFEVYHEMRKNLGEELTVRILTEDFLSQIDWELYHKFCNGGANLEDIRLKG